MPKVVPHLATLASYPLAAVKPSAGGATWVSLAQNESACAPSEAALAAAFDALRNARLYPDPDWTDLRQAIARFHDVDPVDIICGSGSMDLIEAVARCFLAPGLAALTTEHGYYFFRTAALLTGAALHLAPERDLAVDVDGILARLAPETRVVFVANPGNPTGTLVDTGELVRLREAMPDDVLLVIDEAYAEFAPAGETGLFQLVKRGDTVVLRTLSKAYGLAGLRVGWGVFPAAIASEIRKVMLPNNLSGPALAAATAAMCDQAAMKRNVAVISERRERFSARMRSLGIGVPASHTNFVLLVFPSQAAASEADTFLRENGIVMRKVDNYGLANCLRATIGSEDDMNRSAEILGSFMTARSPS